MISRYQDLKIKQIWSKKNQIFTWTKIEILVAKYWNQEGLISDQELRKIAQIKPNLKRMQEIEQLVQHEVAAFIKMLSEQIGIEGKWIHYGLTSNDILDTGQNYLLKQSCILIKDQLQNILTLLKKKAHQEKKVICLGRTHGVVAEPITVGWKFALWFEELRQHSFRLEVALEEINYVKIFGPTGISAHFSPNLNKFVAQSLNMKPVSTASQLFGRHHLIAFFTCLTNLATSLEKMCTEIRNLHRSEINEMSEGFDSQQKGSSAMPHKKNPIICENICGLVRLLRSLQQNFYHTNLLWHERDLTNSAIERVAIPDFLHLLVTTLKRFEKVLINLKINHWQITDNLKKYQGEIFSHKLLLSLLKNSHLSREDAYQLVQRASFLAKQKKQNFVTVLKAEGILQYLSIQQLQACFDLSSFLVHIDELFAQVFIDS